MNVTMGMALNALPVHSLTEAFLELIEPVDDRGSLSLDLFERFITHPFLNKATATLKLIAALRQLQRTRIGIDLLEEKASVVNFRTRRNWSIVSLREVRVRPVSPPNFNGCSS